MASYVTGVQQVANNLMMHKYKMLAKVGEAIEKTCIDVANHAKAGHAGNAAHMNKRYRNQTTNLTNSITPELVEINLQRAHGIVHTGAIEYAAVVEFGNTTGVNVRTGKKNKPYPYMVPALLAGKEVFQKRMKKILK